jgi:uncharacterized membrane protein YdfJ with MMPL/SSD domain
MSLSQDFLRRWIADHRTAVVAVWLVIAVALQVAAR